MEISEEELLTIISFWNNNYFTDIDPDELSLLSRIIIDHSNGDKVIREGIEAYKIESGLVEAFKKIDMEKEIEDLLNK